jgi:hypothetical protein
MAEASAMPYVSAWESLPIAWHVSASVGWVSHSYLWIELLMLDGLAGV